MWTRGSKLIGRVQENGAFNEEKARTNNIIVKQLGDVKVKDFYQ